MLWLLFVAIVLLGISLFLQKYSNVHSKSWFRLFTNPKWISAALLAFVSFVVYMYVLGGERISVVQPLMSLSIVIAMILSAVFLKEKIKKMDGFAFLLIIIGLFLIGGFVVV